MMITKVIQITMKNGMTMTVHEIWGFVLLYVIFLLGKYLLDPKKDNNE